jgi:hypothetical protein
MDLDEAIAALRELNEDVPKPLRLPTEAEVAAVEKKLGVKFHPDFRRFHLEASDVVYGSKEPVTITAPGDHTDLLEVAREAWDTCEIDKTLLPVCEDNGDFYCINPKGEVLFCPHDGASKEKWPSLAAWIEQVWIGEEEE